MKKIFYILFFFLFSLPFGKGWGWAVTAQNLVPNPSFEDTVRCPGEFGGFSEMEAAKSWGTAKGSPDYFNSCYTDNNNSANVSVPRNCLGLQNAATGVAYAGFLTYIGSYNPYEREWVKCSIISPLIIGKKYTISFKVSLADSSNCATNNIGVLFKTDSIGYYDVNTLQPNYSHFKTSVIIKDTTNWTIVSGSFTADSAYKYMMIGNFYDYSLTDSILLHNRKVNGIGYYFDSGRCYAYYYIDDIYVWKDTTNGIENLVKESTDVYVNGNKLIIKTNSLNNYSYIITDMFGRTVKADKNIQNNYEIDIGELSSGVYITSIWFNKNTINKKIILIK